ncbi:g269 [Coccomyxa viridis]|uniref:G269 protein n=1 Tax=Coccomyxa viridis TaxID=1274662 RepID=A0ABP1FFB0_9CHLO
MQHSPQHGGSARPAAESASGQKQEGSAGSRRFTPAQQAVATALMVVMKRALTDGREAALAAMLILGSNNLFTRRFLMMLSNSSPPPTMKEIEQRATDQLLEHLTELATQCARVQCQPLEVFTRSMQCAARVTHRDLFEELGERGPLDWELWKMPRSMPYYSPDALERLQRDGMPRVLAHLWLTFTEALNVYNLDPKTAVLAAPDLNHMLPGLVNMLQEGAIIGIHRLPKLVTALTTALKTYHIRAEKCGQSFQHMVLLEAGVQGWSLETPYISKLLRAILAAEPAKSSFGTTPSHDAPQASPSGAAEVLS